VKPQRPYLLRALYEWIVDCDQIPYVLVDATVAGVQVPQEHIKDGQIVLNMGPNAVQDLVIDDQYVMCGGRFGGKHFELYVPMLAVLAIYAKDTRKGMVFPDEENLTAAERHTHEGDSAPNPRDDKPSLRLV